MKLKEWPPNRKSGAWFDALVQRTLGKPNQEPFPAADFTPLDVDSLLKEFDVEALKQLEAEASLKEMDLDSLLTVYSSGGKKKNPLTRHEQIANLLYPVPNAASKNMDIDDIEPIPIDHEFKFVPIHSGEQELDQEVLNYKLGGTSG